MKSVRIQSFSGLYLPACGLNKERYVEVLSVFSPNAGKYGPEKLRITRHAILRNRGVFRTMKNAYDGVFFSEIIHFYNHKKSSITNA